MTKFSLLAYACLLCAAGCASVPEGAKSVLVPISASCVPANTPIAPTVSQPHELAGLSDYEFVLRIASEWYELRAWASLIAPILDACK